MRTLKKALEALFREEESEWDVRLQAAAFAHSWTPHTGTSYSPFFVVHGREAVLPVQRHLDTPRLAAPSRRWLDRL